MKTTQNWISGFMAFAVMWANGGFAFAADVTGRADALARMEREQARVRLADSIGQVLSSGAFDLPTDQAEAKFMKLLDKGTDQLKAQARARIASQTEDQAQAQLKKMTDAAWMSGNEAVQEQLSELALDSGSTAREKLSSLVTNTQDQEMRKAVSEAIRTEGSVNKMLKSIQKKLNDKDDNLGDILFWAIPLAAGIVAGVLTGVLTESLLLGIAVGAGTPLLIAGAFFIFLFIVFANMD